MGLLEAAAASLVGGERRIATAARNVANVTTPTYKSEIAYTVSVAEADGGKFERTTSSLPVVSSSINSAQGRLIATEYAYHLAISGAGFILVRDGSSYFASRGGEMKLGADGMLQDALGRVVQQAGGGDLEVPAAGLEVLEDGTVLVGGTPVGSIGLFEVDEGLRTRALSASEMAGLMDASDTELRQGMLEQSNVILSHEMVEVMRAQRQVESGGQLVRTYDQLMSQVISTFARGGS